MKIHNIRLGLATNSSSTHSIVFFPKWLGNAKEIEPEYGPNNYGWDRFQLVSPNAKLGYLAQSLYSQLYQTVGEGIARLVVREWVGTDPDSGGLVDHQSTLDFPYNWDGKGLNHEFITDFKHFLLQDDIVIAGGNDNEEAVAPVLEKGGRPIKVMELEGRGLGMKGCVARKDDGYWTIFNRTTGAKLRVSFDPMVTTPLVKRSKAPELVDIKITDFCPFGCQFCYQDSTLVGEHGNKDLIYHLASALGDMNVFEVAIGGGEPTLHPNFAELLADFRRYGVVPNFTTKSLGWLKDPKQREPILKHMGAFAFSAETADEVDQLADTMSKADLVGAYYADGVRVTIQHVIGVAEESEFRKILNRCAKHMFPVTLLGYKQVGRGPSFGQKPSAKWLKILRDICDRHHLTVGIDTALADRYWDDLLAAGVPESCLTRTEGQFSCYIDAVARTMHTSSYSGTPGVSIGNHVFADKLETIYRELA